MPYNKGALADTPQPFAPVEVGELRCLGLRQTDGRPGLFGLAAFVGVDDPGRAVCQQPERHGPGSRVGVAHGVEIRQPVDHQEVRDE